MIAVLVNPRSRANRRNPRIAAEFQALVGDRGRVFAPKSFDELDAAVAEWRRSPPDVIAVHGGDGTLHKTVTALGRVFGADPIPPVAILCGGTMNVVATSLAIKERPSVFLTAIVEAARAGRPLDTIRRRCLRIGDELGFLFGSGLAANFLTEYYAPSGYGPGRAAWLLFRGFLSATWNGPFIRRLFKRFEGSVRVDGQLLERTTFVGLMAGTVREVGLGFKLVHRADDDPERFGVLAIHGRPMSLTADLWAVQRGRGISERRAFSAVASEMHVQSKNGAFAYTIDGDLYRAQEPVAISLGPHIDFLKPPSALIVRPRSDSMDGQR
ncbi:MAG TPA: diacylglycerol kinase family protein [Polyangia bacterium]|jgi:diacylglycerol kinase family enzyme